MRRIQERVIDVFLGASLSARDASLVADVVVEFGSSGSLPSRVESLFVLWVLSSDSH